MKIIKKIFALITIMTKIQKMANALKEEAKMCNVFF